MQTYIQDKYKELLLLSRTTEQKLEKLSKIRMKRQHLTILMSNIRESIMGIFKTTLSTHREIRQHFYCKAVVSQSTSKNSYYHPLKRKST